MSALFDGDILLIRSRTVISGIRLNSKVSQGVRFCTSTLTCCTSGTDLAYWDRAGIIIVPEGDKNADNVVIVQAGESAVFSQTWRQVSDHSEAIAVRHLTHGSKYEMAVRNLIKLIPPLINQRLEDCCDPINRIMSKLERYRQSVSLNLEEFRQADLIIDRFKRECGGNAIGLQELMLITAELEKEHINYFTFGAVEGAHRILFYALLTDNQMMLQVQHLIGEIIDSGATRSLSRVRVLEEWSSCALGSVRASVDNAELISGTFVASCLRKTGLLPADTLGSDLIRPVELSQEDKHDAFQPGEFIIAF